MSPIQMTLACTALLVASGCAADATDEGSGATEGAATTTGAIQISGEWAVVRVKGSVLEGAGAAVKDVPINRAFEARSSTAKATLSIDGDGNGAMIGKKTCRPDIEQAREGVEKQATRGANFVTGAMMLVRAVAGLVESSHCRGGELEEATVRLWQTRGFFGRPDPRLPGNVGVLGEAKSGTSAESECKALHGARYVSMDTGSGCIGYADGAARTVRMLFVRVGEIYVQRIDMQRPGGG